MVRGARYRARIKGLPFNIDKSDVVIPDVCPVLGIPLFTSHGKHTDNSPSLDRVVPSLGYVKGNVVVISNLANTIKTNATWDQIALVALWLKGMSVEKTVN